MKPLWHPETESDLAGRETIAAMSGLEFLAAILAGRLPAPPICKTLNFWPESVREGEAVFVGSPRFEAMNPIGSIHGGWFGTVLDSCMACAFQTTLPIGKGYTTLEYKVNIVRAIRPGTGTYRATGTVDHAGRTTGVATGKLVGIDDGRLYATGSTTCLTLDL